MPQGKKKCQRNSKHKVQYLSVAWNRLEGDWTDNKNEMIETNQSLDTLIANSIDLIQYARQFGVAYDILFHLANGL